jgi:hypothetical protein
MTMPMTGRAGRLLFAFYGNPELSFPAYAGRSCQVLPRTQDQFFWSELSQGTESESAGKGA